MRNRPPRVVTVISYWFESVQLVFVVDTLDLQSPLLTWAERGVCVYI
jgi:hypothetical protein